MAARLGELDRVADGAFEHPTFGILQRSESTLTAPDMGRGEVRGVQSRERSEPMEIKWFA
jgi:hypothetical protein